MDDSFKQIGAESTIIVNNDRVPTNIVSLFMFEYDVFQQIFSIESQKSIMLMVIE